MTSSLYHPPSLPQPRLQLRLRSFLPRLRLLFVPEACSLAFFLSRFAVPSILHLFTPQPCCFLQFSNYTLCADLQTSLFPHYRFLSAPKAARYPLPTLFSLSIASPLAFLVSSAAVPPLPHFHSSLTLCHLRSLHCFFRRSPNASIPTSSLLVRTGNVALSLFAIFISSTCMLFGVSCEPRRSAATPTPSFFSTSLPFLFVTLPCSPFFADHSMDHFSALELLPHCS